MTISDECGGGILYLRLAIGDWRESATGNRQSAVCTAWLTGEKTEQAFWDLPGYDFNVRTHKVLLKKLDSCHRSPLIRGLIGRAEDWAWSSYRYYEFRDKSVLKMDWNGTWPIIW